MSVLLVIKLCAQKLRITTVFVEIPMIKWSVYGQIVRNRYIKSLYIKMCRKTVVFIYIVGRWGMSWQLYRARTQKQVDRQMWPTHWVSIPQNHHPLITPTDWFSPSVSALCVTAVFSGEGDICLVLTCVPVWYDTAMFLQYAWQHLPRNNKKVGEEREWERERC